MPPKGRRKLDSDATRTAEDAYALITRFAGTEGELFDDTIRALMDCPGVVRALGLPGDSHLDTDAASAMMASVRSTFAGRLHTTGSRHGAEREQAQSIAAAMYSDSVSRERAKTLAGIPRESWEGGQKLAANNDAAARGAQSSTLGITEHTDHVPWLKVWDWFHTSTSLVEINKQTKRQYKRKNFVLPDGKIIPLTCEHRIRFCTAGDLGAAFLKSDLYKELTSEGKSISVRSAQACICPCIKEVRSGEWWIFNFPPHTQPSLPKASAHPTLTHPR